MRNEDYDRELLVVVTLICVALSAAVSLPEMAPRSVGKAISQAPTRLEQLEPVRIIGTPFTPNTNPSVR